MRLISLISVTAAFALGACDAADREALGLAKPATPPTPAAASAALVFPPAAPGRAARLYPLAQPRNGHRARRAGHRQAGEARAFAYAASGGGYAETRSQEQSVGAQTAWRERHDEFAEGYGRDDLRPSATPEAAGRDRHGFLTWPGKIPARP